MEQTDRTDIEQLATDNAEIRHLLTRHRGLEREIDRLASVRFPSELERRELARLKLLKLRGKDRMAVILRNNGG